VGSPPSAPCFDDGGDNRSKGGKGGIKTPALLCSRMAMTSASLNWGETVQLSSSVTDNEGGEGNVGKTNILDVVGPILYTRKRLIYNNPAAIQLLQVSSRGSSWEA